MSAARSQCQVFLGQPLFLFPRVPAEGLPCDVTCRGEVWELISEFEFSFSLSQVVLVQKQSID